MVEVVRAYQSTLSGLVEVPAAGSSEEPGYLVGLWKGWDVRSLGLVAVHDRGLCAGRVCVVHAPTRHRMSRWPVVWRGDRGIVERLCPHGIGHPDPDQSEFWSTSGGGAAAMWVHGCDGCCGGVR